MTGLAAYLAALNTRFDGLLRTLPRLRRTLDQAVQLQKLGEVVDEIKSIQKTVVLDNQTMFGMRSPRSWVIVGPGGIADDVKIVAEGMSIFSLGIEQPDLERYRGEGKLIIPGKDFLNLADWLRSEALAGRMVLPYLISKGT